MPRKIVVSIPLSSGDASSRHRLERRMFMLLLTIAWLAELLWIIDRIYFRNFQIDSNFLERREAIEESGSTILSMASALFSSASFLSWCLLKKLSEVKKPSKFFVLLSFVALWFPSINAIALGSRSTPMITLMYFLLINLYFREKPINIRSIIILIVVGLTAITGMTQIFLQRLDVMGMSAVFSIQNSVYAFTLQPKQFLINALNSDPSGIYSAFLFSLSNVAQYYSHGMFELFYQLDNFSSSRHAMGANIFFVPYKMLAAFFALPDVYELMRNSRPHYGAYSTFFGPLHSDFGWFSVFPALILGFIFSAVQNLSRRNFAFVPLYIFFVQATIFFPVVNVFVLGVGFYLLVGFFAFGLAARKLYKKR